MTQGRTVRVVLADDHTMFRQGLARILNSHAGIDVVREVPNDPEVVRVVREEEPDVIIMQVQMPFGRAKQTLKEMRSLPHPPKVVILTVFEEPYYARELLELGASAYLLKSSSAEQLIAAVQTAVFDPEGEHAVIGMPGEMLGQTQEGQKSILSSREMEIVLLAARGMSNRLIAVALYLSESTVKRHLANVYEKMEVSSRHEAVRKALNEGWITVEEITTDNKGEGSDDH